MVEYGQPDYTIWSRHSDRSNSTTPAVYQYAYQRIDQIEDYQGLHLDLKWADTSTWALTLPTNEFLKKWAVNAPTETLLSDGYGKRGIMIFRNGGRFPTADDYPTYDNGDLVLSGVMTNVRREGEGASDVITVTGESDTHYLKTLLSWPHHLALPNVTRHYWEYPALTKWFVETQYAALPIEYIMKTELRKSMSDWAYSGATGRELHYFWHGDYSYPADPTYKGQGDLVDYSTRFDSCYDICQNLMKLQTTHHRYAKPGAEVDWISGEPDIPYFGFDVVQVSESAVGGGASAYIPTGPGDCRLLFRFLTPRDKRAGLVFGTELGNIAKFEYEERAPDCNYCFVGGPNWDGTAQSSNDSDMIYTAADHTVSRNLYGRTEAFETSQSADMQTPTLAALLSAMNATANKTLREKAINISATITLDPIESTTFMKEFQLGDFVTVNLNGQQWKDFIREIAIDVTPEGGEMVTPTVCDPWKFYWSQGATGRLSREMVSKLKKMRSK